MTDTTHSQQLEVAIAAGGTAGHVNPALALAEELTQRGHHVTFYGQPNRLEAKLVPEAGYDFVPLRVTGFDRSRPWTLATALWRIHKAKIELDRRFSTTGAPDVAVGFGAYVELPLIDWCAAHKVPVVLHEQNSVPGLANKTSAKKASAVCVAFPAATEAFQKILGSHDGRIKITGNPVRKSIVLSTREAGRQAIGIPQDARLLVVFGGSLGAKHLNAAIAALKSKLLARQDLYVIHSTGTADFDKTVLNLDLTPSEQQRYRVMPYISNMGDMLAAADFVISRAGASSIAEIAALSVPSVLVPYPFATADHQTTNAHLLVDCGAAHLVPDSQLDEKIFSQTVISLIDNPAQLASMRAAADGLGSAGAAALLANEVESVSKAGA